MLWPYGSTVLAWRETCFFSFKNCFLVRKKLGNFCFLNRWQPVVSKVHFNQALLCFSLQCCIDLKNNVLRIGTTGTETPFLAESDLPMTDRLAFNEEGAQMEVEDKQLAEMEDKELAEAMDRSAKEAAQGASSSSSSQSFPSQSSSGSAVSSSSSGTSVTSFPEASIQRIVELGFTRDQAILELQRANGNVDVAATALLARSLKLPSSTKR